MLVVWVQRDMREAQRHEVAGNDVSIGRSLRSDIVLGEDDVVAEHHARIVASGDRLVLVDMGSAAGTWFDDRRHQGVGILIPGQRFRIGETTLWVEVTPASATPAAGDTADDEPTPPMAALRGRAHTVPSARPPGVASRDAEITAESFADEERYLLEMIHRKPDSDEARLVYADWLLERGDPRGELIILQCSDSWRDAEAGASKLHSLLDGHGSDWLRVAVGQAAVVFVMNERRVTAVAHRVYPLEIVRGFLAHPMCVTSDELARSADRLYRLSPTLYEVLHVVRRNEQTTFFSGQARGPAGSITPVLLKQCDAHGERYLRMTSSVHYAARQRRRVANELAIACAVAHRNIVRYLGLGYWVRTGRLVLVQEWIDGATLEQLLERRHGAPTAFSPVLAVSIAREVLAGLEHMHLACDLEGTPARIAHTRVEPGHVMITRDGLVKLIGLWHAYSEVELPLPSAIAEQHTGTDAIDDTGRWPLPPALLGRLTSAQREDLHDLGAVLYEMVCGRALPSGAVRRDDDIERATIMSPSALADMPAALERIILHALSDVGYSAAELMRADLDKVIESEGWASGPAFIARELRRFWPEDQPGNQDARDLYWSEDG